MLTLTCCQDHILTENIWFVCSETSYSGYERRCYRCGTNKQTTEQLKIELLRQWKPEAESRNFHIPERVLLSTTSWFIQCSLALLCRLLPLPLAHSPGNARVRFRNCPINSSSLSFWTACSSFDSGQPRLHHVPSPQVLPNTQIIMASHCTSQFSDITSHIVLR